MKKILFIVLGVVLGFAANAQELKEADRARAIQAIELMDNKQPDKAIVILDSLTRAYPDNYDLWAELNNAYFRNADLDSVVNLSARLIKEMPASTKESTCALIISTAGNAYDHLGRVDDAIRMYDLGISRCPGSSGVLYYNKGVTYENNVNDFEALKTYIMGMKTQPEWMSNYLGSIRTASALNTRSILILNIVALLMANPDEELSKQVAELTADTLKGIVQENEEGNYEISISPNFIDVSAPELMLSDMSLALSIGAGVEEFGLGNVRTYVDVLCKLSSLDEIVDHPLIPYLQQLQDEGLDEAFWYYILANEYPVDFQDWSEQNMATLQRLGEFLESHPYAEEVQSGILVTPGE